MTIIAAFITEDGAGFVSDHRIVYGPNILSDKFNKIYPVGEYLTVAIAGSMGPAQMWLRGAEGAEADTIGELMDAFVPGEHESIVYDKREHVLLVVDGEGSMVLMPEFAVMGAGADFVRGYLAAAPASTLANSRLLSLSDAIEACSRVNLSVSAETDVVWVPRQAKAKPARKRARRKSRQAA